MQSRSQFVAVIGARPVELSMAAAGEKAIYEN